ncbi:hypothetical protein C8035_v009109 [Colletotrichum spinosum]|uniref:Uncharacterized protein n=1 Tax=Colletotrichum spinosum TaxID=1347390 RepID=A0A4R8PMZ4_9PEZI|nr:hypothetical protein C8035_v009109 [Colletotrichum spinosum]
MAGCWLVKEAQQPLDRGGAKRGFLGEWGIRVSCGLSSMGAVSVVSRVLRPAPVLSRGSAILTSPKQDTKAPTFPALVRVALAENQDYPSGISPGEEKRRPGPWPRRQLE